MWKSNGLLALVLAGVLVSHGAQADELTAGDKAKGEALFGHMCVTCHALTSNRMGPQLGGVYGRKAGAVPEFNYSSAVKASDVTWNSDTLDKWLSGPSKFVPGARMIFVVSDPQKRSDVIAYLKSLSDAENKK